MKPKSKPLVSVVINVRNGEKFISQSMESALRQVGVDLEVIVWDNCSTDKTAEIVGSYGDERVRYHLGSQPLPLYEARNLAVAECTGEFVAFLDCDDWWEPNKLSAQLEMFSAEVDAVYSNFFLVNDVTGRSRKYSRRPLPEGQIFSELLKRYRIGMLTLVVRREVFKNQGFNPEMEIIGDFDFVVKLARRSLFRCVQEPLAWNRFHGNNESEKKKGLHAAELTEWCRAEAESGLLLGRNLRYVQRIARAKRAEVEFSGGQYLRGLKALAGTRPSGHQLKAIQRGLAARRSMENRPHRSDRLSESDC